MIQTWQAVDGGTDGRDRSIIGTFVRKSDAEEAAVGRGTMGHGDGAVQPGPSFYESWSDYKKNGPASVRERALAKLTPEERAALGLK